MAETTAAKPAAKDSDIAGKATAKGYRLISRVTITRKGSGGDAKEEHVAPGREFYESIQAEAERLVGLEAAAPYTAANARKYLADISEVEGE